MISVKELSANKIKKLFLGNQKRYGFLETLLIYLLLIGIGFVFIYPVLVLLSTSIKNIYDLVNPLVKWIPETLYWDNYVRAYKVMGGIKVLINSILYMGLIAVVQTFVAAVIGYGLAKYDFWCKKLIIVLIICTFIIPSEMLFLPQYIFFSKYKLVNSIYPMLLPAMFGQGYRNAIYILIFYQFFRMSPKSLDEAAAIDGAGHLKTFFFINMRMAVPAIIVDFVFSFVWNWNDTNTATRFFGGKVITVAMALQRFKDAYAGQFPFVATNDPLLRLNEGVEMAGAILSIIPLILLYAIVEKKLVESIDRAGITGE